MGMERQIPVMYNIHRNDYQYCSCAWCGQWISKHTYMKRKERKLPDMDVCKDCRDTRKAEPARADKTRRTEHPELGVIYCYLWDGDLNDDWLPIDDKGRLYMPGERVCGFKDCVASQHVIETSAKVSGKIKVESALAKELTPHNR